jgi:hypothetical protein
MIKTISPQQIEFMSRLETSLGIPLDGEAVSSLRKSSRGIVVCQTGYFFENEVVELDCRGTGVTVSVGIENPSHTVITIDQFWLELPWTQPSWLKEPPKKDYGYQMPDPLRHPYAREQVLNHRVGRRGKIYPGDLVEGVLLGISKESISAEYADQQKLCTRLWVFDTRGKSYTCRLLLAVSRTKPVKRPSHHRRMYRGPLFGRTMDEIGARVQNTSSALVAVNEPI